MTRKEKMDLLLSKVAEDRKEDFIADLRAAKNPEERLNVVNQYDITLTEDEAKAFQANSGNEVSNEDLDKVAGGVCNCKCACGW